jgi:hypothetical protein
VQRSHQAAEARTAAAALRRRLDQTIRQTMLPTLGRALGNLSLRLSVADAPPRYDARIDRYPAPGPGQRADVEPGELLWQTHLGGRKGGGVWYTPAELVRHLVARLAELPPAR